MDETEYRVRQHAFEPERLWRVGSDGLSWEAGEKRGHFDFSEITSIRLSYTPTRFDFARYRCTITRFNGWRENFTSTSYAGIGQFDDRAPAYGRFVRNLIAQASRANPAIRLEAGELHLKYWSKHRHSRWRLGSSCDRDASRSVSMRPGSSWSNLLVIAFLLPIGLRWIAKNRPRPFSADAIPTEVLPDDASDHRQ